MQIKICQAIYTKLIFHRNNDLLIFHRNNDIHKLEIKIAYSFELLDSKTEKQSSVTPLLGI